jgi:CobW/HypB/UreG, nucleotide-binding domain
VGGFLGAGKTTLILAAARILQQRGLRVAVIMNDQGRDLVDSRYSAAHAINAREITGGCFCCRFSALSSVLDDLRAWRPDVIFAEPVGSCTDLAATVIGPLREQGDRYRIAPLTVLVDPARAASLKSRDADSDMQFLFDAQLEEADLICISKADLYPDPVPLAGKPVRCLSARSGQGIEEWLSEILASTVAPGTNTLNLDYQRYARAEAALAWLNLSFLFDAERPMTPAAVVGPFLDGLDRGLTSANIPIVHLKLIDDTSTGWLKAATCGNGDAPSVEGALDASPASRHEILVNLRAVGDPAVVRAVAEKQLHCLEGITSHVQLDCFRPAPPAPERRVPGRASA